MFRTTEVLIEGLQTMLKSRGSMTVEEVQLLRDVIAFLEKHEKLKGDERLRNGVRVVEMMIRFLLNPGVSEKVSQIVSDLIDKLL